MIKKLFKIQDLDNSNSIRFPEVVIISSDPTKLKDFFVRADKNKDGAITLEEYTELFQNKKDVATLYNWLIKFKPEIEKIRDHWVSTCQETDGLNYHLSTAMYKEEVFRVILHLNLNHVQIMNLQNYLNQQKLFENAYVYYGELISLICCWMNNSERKNEK